MSNPGLVIFIMRQNPKDRADLMAKISASYPHVGSRDLQLAFAAVRREIHRVAPELAVLHARSRLKR
jgi:hypothetical protein